MAKITKSALFLFFILLLFGRAVYSNTVDDILGDGFRNLKWGTEYKNISGLYERQMTEDGKVSYSRQPDELFFCNVKLDKISYYFDESGYLYSVILRTKGKDASFLVDAMLKRFGKSEDVTEQQWWVGPSEDCIYYYWSGKNTNIIVQHYLFDGEFVNVIITQNGRTPGGW